MKGMINVPYIKAHSFIFGWEPIHHGKMEHIFILGLRKEKVMQMIFYSMKELESKVSKKAAQRVRPSIIPSIINTQKGKKTKKK